MTRKPVTDAEYDRAEKDLRRQCYAKETGRHRFNEFKRWLKKADGLLEFVTTTYVAAIEKFVVAELLSEAALNKDCVNKDGVQVAFLGDNFKAQIVPLIESYTPAAELEVDRLTRYAKALDIAGALPDDVRITTPGQMYQLVKVQKDGTDVPLLINGYVNLFLMYGFDGNVWAVRAVRLSDGWRFRASPLGGSVEWFDGSQVFSQVA